VSNAIIAGGRDYILGQDEVDWLDTLLEKIEFKCVVSGTARGSDTCGEMWAKMRGLGVIRMPADWKNLGMRAGRVRNVEMAKVADNVFLFPGGKGTAHMNEIAGEFKIPTYEYPGEGNWSPE
jgi:hypothetical protein